MAARRSLFAILIDQPWWVSLLAAAVMYGFGLMVASLLPRGVFPHLIGAAAALPFVGIAGYVGWLRIRRGG